MCLSVGNGLCPVPNSGRRDVGPYIQMPLFFVGNGFNLFRGRIGREADPYKGNGSGMPEYGHSSGLTTNPFLTGLARTYSHIFKKLSSFLMM